MPLDHVFGDARLPDFKPELEQFAVDARRAPQRVLDTHSPDQGAQLCVNLRSSSKRVRDGRIVFKNACAIGCEGIVSKRLGSTYRSGRVRHWVKVKNPKAPAVRREAEEDWG